MENNREMKFGNIILSNIVDDNSEFIPIIADGNEKELDETVIPEDLPILPLRNTVLFPGVVIPITVGRDKSLRLIKDIYKSNKIIGTVTQKEIAIEEPEAKDLYSTGTLAQVIKVLEMPDNTTSIIIQGRKRFDVIEFTQENPYFVAKVKDRPDIKPVLEDKEYEAIVGSLKDLATKVIKLSSQIPQEAIFALKNINNTNFLVNFISSNTEISSEEKQELLEIDDTKQRAIKLLEYLSREIQMLELKKDIQHKVKYELEKQQREFLLNQQMKTIQEELGGNQLDKEIEEMKKKASKKKWNKEVKDTFNKEIEKLQRLNPAAGEYSVQLNYLHTILELPWNEYTKDNFDLENAEKVLNEDHYGLEKVKERILEHLA
ncbi:MAG: endopeptidase La, partial [Marinilabiliales bacterium]